MTSGVVYERLVPHVKGRTSIVVDLRCASAEPLEDLSLPRLARDVLEIASHAEAETFDLVGHSMGGQVAMIAAAEAAPRVRTLGLVCPVPLSGATLPTEAGALFSSAGGDREKIGEVLDLAAPGLRPEDRDVLVGEALRIAPATIRRVYEAWSRGHDGAIDVDVRSLVVATDDPFLPPAFLDENVVRRIRSARMAYLAGPGHYPVVERPIETAALLAELWA